MTLIFETKDVLRVLMENPLGKKPPAGRSRRWKGKFNTREVGYKSGGGWNCLRIIYNEGMRY
jgi:hypothetical protein